MIAAAAVVLTVVLALVWAGWDELARPRWRRRPPPGTETHNPGCICVRCSTERERLAVHLHRTTHRRKYP